MSKITSSRGIDNNSFDEISIQYYGTVQDEKLSNGGVAGHDGPIGGGGGGGGGEGEVEQFEEEDEENLGFFKILEPLLAKNPNGLAYQLFFSKKERTEKMVKKSVPVLLLCASVIYLILVIVIYSKIQKTLYWCSGDGLLYILYVVVGASLIYFHIIKKYLGKYLTRKFIQPLSKSFNKLWTHWYVKTIFYVVIIGGVVTFLVIDTADERRRLISLIGLAFLIAFGFVFSNAPMKVKWRHIIWGISIQFILGLLVLRWPVGNDILNCFSGKVTEFLAFATEGAVFVFGPLAVLPDPYNVFAFSVLPVTIYFSFFTSILYYYGIIQWVVVKVGWLFQITIGTTLCESMNASASIFLGMTESPLLIKPYIAIMTKSELHAVMTGGFATIAGSLLAAYIALGVEPSLLLTASVMNAPAALAMSKLFYPETRKTRITAESVSSIKSNEINVLHAGCVGVTNALPLVANIAGNLIAFIAFIALFNSVFDWGCQLVNFDEGTCSLEGIFGYIFMPLAWMMGVIWEDCYNVGQLIGLKVILNEFVAYGQLSIFIDEGSLSVRSQAIATFALCGFSNISSIGIMMGGLFPMAPTRKNDMVKVVTRAMIAGSMATFSSACIAGTLLSTDLLTAVGNGTSTAPVSSSMSYLATTVSTLFFSSTT